MKTFLQSIFLVLITMSGLHGKETNLSVSTKIGFVFELVDSSHLMVKEFSGELPYADQNHAFNSLVCFDTTVISVYPGIEKQVHRHDILDKNTTTTIGFLQSVITLEDELGQEYPDNRFSFDEIGKYIIGRATLLSNGNTCTTRILLDSCPYYQFCDTVCSSYPGMECEDGIFSQLKWPCDITLNDCSGSTPVNNHYSPSKLLDITGMDISNFSPQLNNLACQEINIYYNDEIIDSLNSKIINRKFRVVHEDINESRTYTQVITISISSLEICDFLPWNAPDGDCVSGHTLEDMVEWPADFVTGARDIDPSQLEYNNLFITNVNNLRPVFYNHCVIPPTEFTDETVQLNDTTFMTNRTWKITDPITEATYTYVQEITQVFDDKVVLCVESGNGDPITQIELEPFESMVFSNVHYNDDQCIEMIWANFQSAYIPESFLHIEKDISGINVEDMQLLNDHILGNTNLELVPQLFAGDCNHDDRISASDRVHILNLVLGRANELYWRILDKNKLNDTIHGPVADLSIDEDNRYLDLILVKTGDLNFSQFTGEIYDGNLVLKVEDQILNRGEYYTIPLIVQNNSILRSFQLEFSQNELLIDQFTYSHYNSPASFAAPEDVFDNKMVLLYFSDQPQILMEEDTFITLNFRAMENGILSEMISLYSDENNLAVMPVGQLPKKIVIDWKDRIINNNVQEIELEKIILFPNPASQYLEIKGISSDLTYHISDLLGKVCISGHIESDQRLDLTDLNNGMYVLTIKNPFAASKSFKFFVAK